MITVPVAVILAGGMSRRMGRDKLSIEINGQTMLESIIGRFSEVFESVYLSVADETKYPGIKARRIKDVLPGAGPASGLHAALTYIPSGGVFIVAADLPYACPKTAMEIVRLAGDSDACLIRLPNGMVEPLFGYYNKSILPRCIDAIKAGDNKIARIVDGANTRYVEPGELGEAWDEKLLMNINSPKDLKLLL